MPITSQITMKPIIGTDPVGYIPFPMPPNAPQNYIAPNRFELIKDETSLFPITIDPIANQNDFLTAVKLVLDSEYAASNFTDPAKDYFLDYTITNISRTYVAPSNSIWEKRDYVWKVSVLIKVNTDY